ncbi:MAG TPA: NDP-sugar synthase [archaeon]|nr:NDP-sugar synthase [archaeon]
MTPKRNIYKRDVVAVSPIGGGGTRFYPATIDTPKHLMPIANHPIFGASVYHWIVGGVSDVVFGATGYNNRVQTKRFFGGGGRYSKLSDKVKVYFCNYDDRVFRNHGSADVFAWALDEYKEMMGNRDVLLVNGDNLSETSLDDFYQAHHETGALMTIAVKGFNINDARLGGFGTVAFDDKKRVTEFKEKSAVPLSKYANTAICIFSPDIHDLMHSGDFTKALEERRSKGRLDVGGHFIPALLDYGAPIYAYVLKGPWADIGTSESFTETTRDILHGEYPNLGYPDHHLVGKALVHNDTHERMKGRFDDTTFDGPCLVDRQSIIGEKTRISNSVIGENVVVGDNVVIDDVTTLFPFSHVDSNSEITQAIIGHHTYVGERSVIEAGAFIGDHLELPSGTRIAADWRVVGNTYHDIVSKARTSKGAPMYEDVEELGTVFDSLNERHGAFAFKERKE